MQARPVDDFETSYRTHRHALVRLALLLSGSHELAEDVVQTVFADVHARWADVQDPPAYLRRAVINRVKDVQRRGFRQSASIGSTFSSGVTGVPELDETWAVVGRLPLSQRAVLVLHFYEDRPLAEIADLLRRPASTVRSDLRRALARLRKELS